MINSKWGLQAREMVKSSIPTHAEVRETVEASITAQNEAQARELSEWLGIPLDRSKAILKRMARDNGEPPMDFQETEPSGLCGYAGNTLGLRAKKKLTE